jgi:predicted KAP-like P-loop ATPase
VFVLAFDRERVERALGEGFGGSPEEQAREGRAFVEKIVQIPAELPVVSREHYAFLFRRELAETLRRGGQEVPAERRWDAVLRRIILPLLRNLRDMRRYFAALGMTTELIGDEVALTDVLALEAIRIFRPDVAVRLSAASAALTSVPVDGFPEYTRAAKDELETLVKDLAAHGTLLDAVLKLLFPAGNILLGGSGTSADEASWRRERRVSVEQNLEFYFAKRPGLGDVSNAEVDAVLSALGERERLESLLRRLDGRRLAALLTRLADHREVFRADHVETASSVFFSRFDRLPATDPRNLGFDDQSQLLGLIGAILNLTPEPEQSRAYRALFRDAPSLSARFVLLARSRSADGMLPEMSTRREMN